MNALFTRAITISTYFVERFARGVPERVGNIQNDVLILVDGVGGFQSAVLQVRRCLRLDGRSLPTIVFRWQFGPPGEIWTDLCWIRRNRLMGLKLARKIRALQRAHPNTAIHLMAISGGAGIAVFACEKLRQKPAIETLILVCPALSPEYNLAPALTSVNHGYALVSRLDRVILGLGTRIFGTTDRRFCRAAGMVGFNVPHHATSSEKAAYAKMREIHWAPHFRDFGHYGGHTGWVRSAVVRRCLLGLLEQKSEFPMLTIGPAPVPSGP